MEPKDFIDTFVKGWMYHDIKEAIKGKANFLAALGLLSYTEFMGGLVTGQLRNRQYSQENFKQFICDYFPKEYKDYADNLYEEVRCGLVHEYFVKETNAANATIKYLTGKMGKVINNPDDPEGTANYDCACAIKMKDGKIEFNVNQYFKDFKSAVEKYLGAVSRNTPSLKDNFSRIFPVTGPSTTLTINPMGPMGPTGPAAPIQSSSSGR